jgi:protein phosphatase
MDEMTSGEFAERSWLSATPLRLYDELGLLPPTRVDASSGYRFYCEAQLEPARMVAALRQLQMPLSEIRAILSVNHELAAQPIARDWAVAESHPEARRALARHLVDRLSGRTSVMYDVSTRDTPDRMPLGLKRTVE